MNKLSLASLGLLVIGASALSSCNKLPWETNDLISNVELVPVKTGDKWSMVDPEGNILFEDEFSTSPSLVYNGYFSVANEKDHTFALYRLDGKKYKAVKGLDEVKSVGYVEEGLVPATLPSERIAVFNEEGEKKFELGPVDGHEVTYCAPGFADGYLAFYTDDGKCGFYNTDGEVAIQPIYDAAYSFSGGVALVGKYANEEKSEMTGLIINKEGETVVELPKGSQPSATSPLENFDNGYLIIFNTETQKSSLYNTKGEEFTFPDKVKFISAVDGDYVIFATEDNLYGVCNIKGEIIIQPKYSQLMFNGKSGLLGGILPGSYQFVGSKEGNEEVVFINKDGEEGTKLPYKWIVPYGKFGYFATGGDDKLEIKQIDKEGKEICKETFESITLFQFSANLVINSDFFSPEAIANKIVDLITDKGVGSNTFGSTPGQILKNESPNRYAYSNMVNLDDLNISGNDFSIAAQGYFTGYLADSNYNPYEYRFDYNWNDRVSLGSILMTLKTVNNDWGKAGFDATVKALKKKGFKETKNGYMEGKLAAMFTKGNIGVLVTAVEDGKEETIGVFDTSVEGVGSVYESTMYAITSTKNAVPQTITEYGDDEF